MFRYAQHNFEEAIEDLFAALHSIEAGQEEKEEKRDGRQQNNTDNTDNHGTGGGEGGRKEGGQKDTGEEDKEDEEETTIVVSEINRYLGYSFANRYAAYTFMIHVGCTRRVTSSTDQIVTIHACICLYNFECCIYTFIRPFLYFYLMFEYK